MTEKEKFFDDLREFESSELFLTNSTDLIREEIKHNCVLVSMSSNAAKQASTSDFISFLDRVKVNRRQQLQQSSLNIDLIYYLWFDEQAGQLRFNFINSNHDKLPFGCKIFFVESEKQIIDEFLDSNYLDGIPLSELEIYDKSLQFKREIKGDENIEKTWTVRVYRQIIYRNEVKPLNGF